MKKIIAAVAALGVAVVVAPAASAAGASTPWGTPFVLDAQGWADYCSDAEPGTNYGAYMTDAAFYATFTLIDGIKDYGTYYPGREVALQCRDWTVWDIGAREPLSSYPGTPGTFPLPTESPTTAVVQAGTGNMIGNGNTSMVDSGNTTTINNVTNNITTITNNYLVITINGQPYRVNEDGTLTRMKKKKRR
jgi:hypothetical protein